MMDIPFFFSEALTEKTTTLVLDETASRHAVQVLRMKEGAVLQLANGKGTIAQAAITDAHKKQTTVHINSVTQQQAPTKKIGIAISLVKNAARFEWFLEKATEIGITDVYPLLCQRTERQVFREDRMQQIVISAMLQSQQAWMPVLHKPQPFSNSIQAFAQMDGQKMIAHCLPSEKNPLSTYLLQAVAAGNASKQPSHQLILIGPEGDFTVEEIQVALDHQYQPIALGNTRLRTETAGMVAATLLKLCE